MKQQSKVWLILVALWIINGSSFLAIKISIDTIPPLLSAGIRFSIAGSILVSAYLIRKEYEHEREHIGKKQWKDTIVLAATLFLGGQGLVTWGSQFLSSGMTGLLNSTIPLWVAIIAFVLYRRRMTKLTVMGLAAGFGGLMLLIAPSLGGGTLSPTGVSALLISSVAWAFGSIYSSKAKLPVSILASSGMLMITGGLMLMAISFVLRISRTRYLPNFKYFPTCIDLFDSSNYCYRFYRLLLASESYYRIIGKYICLCKSRNSCHLRVGNTS